MGVLGRPLGVHGAPLGVPGAPLGRPYAHRGGPVSVLSALLGAPERPPGARGGEKAAVAAVPLSFSKMLIFPPWGALGRPWGVLGRLWGALGVSGSASGSSPGAPGAPLGTPGAENGVWSRTAGHATPWAGTTGRGRGGANPSQELGDWGFVDCKPHLHALRPEASADLTLFDLI